MSAYDLAELAQTLFEESGDALFLFDPDTEALLEVNPMAQRLTGHSRRELLRLEVGYLFRSEVQAGLQRLRQAYRKTGLFHSQEGFWLRHQREGVWTPVNLTVTRLHAEARTLGLITARDVTERRQADEVVRTSEAKYRSLVENLEQCVFLKDAELRFVAANGPFCRSVGRAEADVVGKTDHAFYPAELAEKYRADDRLVLAEGRRLELEEQNPDQGKLRTVRVVKTPVKDDQGRAVGVLGIFWDVTEQRALEAQVRQMQKLEALGRLAGGVAHDFNNLLTAILGNVSLVAGSLPEGHPSGEWVHAAERAARRAAGLTGQLLGFSRQSVLRPQPVSLNAALDEVVGMLRCAIDPRIALEVQKGVGLWPAHADAGQVNQVLLNLCLNARDAMPDGGRLTLTTENVTVAGDAGRPSLGARPGEFVRLRVRDTGHGIPPEVLPQIFEPFFTTKGPGKGTGLGLAMVFGIVQQHQGWIDCASAPGQGTCFDVYLPRSTEPEAAAPAEAPRAAGRDGGTVLLVDDEPALRALGQTVLTQHGYEVLLAADGAEAVAVYRRERGRINLVVLDLTMPRLSGADAFAQLVQIDPKVSVVFASGYAAEQVVPGPHQRVLGFLSKPYRPEELAQRVAAALGKARELAAHDGVTW